MKKKSTSVYVPILLAFAAGTWIFTVCFNIYKGETQGFLFVMQCTCIVLYIAAAVAHYIRYRRNKSNKDES